MKCPYCGVDDSRVIDTRSSGDRIRRRRQCIDCERRFTTYEYIALINPIVVKTDGRREEFDRDKLMLGIRKACAKRPISVEDLEKLVDQVATDLQHLGKVEIESRIIGHFVMERLKDIDEIAYLLFASVYMPITDLEGMKVEVDRLLMYRSKR
ncbi:MAG: transcriptional repressor NrdR [Anaerolineae bacterium]|nr:transcriptional repressor NrdR [Anaerolineae bacterium]